MPLMSLTLDTSHFERSPLNDVARMNMPVMSLELDTSHFEMSPLKEFASANTLLISVTLDTSHSAIGPYGPLEQRLLGDNSRHALTAPLSSALDENAVEVSQGFQFRVRIGQRVVVRIRVLSKVSWCD